jgi:uncharacterized phage protein (TIGR01671 family)
MKLLKFRAWHKALKKMFPVVGLALDANPKAVVYLPSPGGEAATEVNWTAQVVAAEELELMQSTGFRDVNGEEIFEGDIVTGEDADDVGCIAWNEKWGAWFVEWSKATGQIVGNVLPLRVIGNIYLVSKQPLDPQPI